MPNPPEDAATRCCLSNRHPLLPTSFSSHSFHAAFSLLSPLSPCISLSLFLPLSLRAHLASALRAHSASSAGDYGDPPQFIRWLQQLGVWLFVVTACKVGVTALQTLFMTPLVRPSPSCPPLCSHPVSVEELDGARLRRSCAQC
eukprot:1770511-Rhodomonas_salina.1